MRTLILATSLFFSLSARVYANVSEFSSPPVEVGLEDVVTRVSSSDLTILENAERVYQAKESIQVARRNLLPRLNLWKVLEVAVDPTSVVGVIEDIAPFLVPGNWFRKEQEKLFYEAQREAYRALWANEVLTAKSLYVHLLTDENLANHLQESSMELRELLGHVRAREQFGSIPVGASKDIEVRLLALEEDKRALDVIMNEDRGILAVMLGYPGNTDLKLKPVALPEFEKLPPIQYEDFEYRVLDLAPEYKQFEYLVRASEKVKKERIFSFLGGSSRSRGIMGGVFDNLPSQDGLGFGLGASVRIVKSQKRILELQARGVQETLRRTLKLLVDNYNLDLENYQNLKKRVALTEEINTRLKDRIRLGRNVPPVELIEASRNHIQAEIAFFAVQYRFMSNAEKLARLLFDGDYTSGPMWPANLK